MFIGEFSHKIDAKGRLAIPVKFRAALKEGAVVTRGLDSCLFIYTKKEWQILATKLAALPLSRADARAFARLMLAGAMDVGIDKQGRILIPDYLRTYGTLSKEVTVAGLFNRVEIWNTENWEKYKNKTERATDTITEHLGELEI